MSWDTWGIYFIAIVGLSFAPGPNGLLALTHGALYGHRKASATIVGGVTGFVLLIALSMFGIGALLQASAHAITLLKWLGGIYLIWLGIQLWRAPTIQLELTADAPDVTLGTLFRTGLFSALSNPKVLLFLGAFLPQFIDPQRALLPQFLIMALTFALVEGSVEYLLARMAYRVRPFLSKSGQRFNQACGGLFVLIGSAMPLAR